MRATHGLVLVGLAAAVTPVDAEVRNEARAAVIRDAIAGKTCVSQRSLVKFGQSAPGVAGTIERNGRIPGTYAIGDGTLLIERGGSLHSHVATISAPGTADAMLHFSGEKFRCKP